MTASPTLSGLPLGHGSLSLESPVRVWGLSKEPEEGVKCGSHCPERPVRAAWAGVGRRFGQVQPRGRRRGRAAGGESGDPRSTPSPPAGNWAGREGPPGRGDTPYTARPVLPGPGPALSFFGQYRGPGRGRGLECPTPKYGSKRGATFLRAGAGGAPAGYIKPELGCDRPPQRTPPSEASLPFHGDQGPSRRAAGVVSHPGRTGVGRGQRGRARPSRLISPQVCTLRLCPQSRSSLKRRHQTIGLRELPNPFPFQAAPPDT